MRNLCTGAMESTKSAPKASGVSRSCGWKSANFEIAASMSSLVWALGCLQAARTIADAMPALIARGYSLACEVFQVPSGFFPIRHPVGALGL